MFSNKKIKFHFRLFAQQSVVLFKIFNEFNEKDFARKSMWFYPIRANLDQQIWYEKHEI